MMYIFGTVPYIAVFFIAFLMLVLFGMRARPAAAVSVIFSFALNLTLTFTLDLTAIRYAYLFLVLVCKVLPYAALIGIIAFIPNAKKILGSVSEEESINPRRFVASVMLTTMLVTMGLIIYNQNPIIIANKEQERYIDRAELRELLTSHDFGSITLYIKVVSASEEGYAAEAVYFPFGGELGVSRTRLPDGRQLGEYYEP